MRKLRAIDVFTWGHRASRCGNLNHVYLLEKVETIDPVSDGSSWWTPEGAVVQYSLVVIPAEPEIKELNAIPAPLLLTTVTAHSPSHALNQCYTPPMHYPGSSPPSVIDRFDR